MTDLTLTEGMTDLTLTEGMTDLTLTEGVTELKSCVKDLVAVLGSLP